MALTSASKRKTKMAKPDAVTLIRAWMEREADYDAQAWPRAKRVIEKNGCPPGAVLMTEAVALDSGPLGRLAHPARNPEIAASLAELLEAGIPVVIPEIVDYELRRSFLLEGLTRSLLRLDRLGEALLFHPINSSAMRKEVLAETKDLDVEGLNVV